MIYLGADHRGYQIKEQIKNYLIAKGHKITDLGTDSTKPIDYPLIAEKVAKKIARDAEARGILICGSGAGVCVVANKVDGVRASEGWNKQAVEAARNDDDINALCLSADMLALDEAEDLIQAFLDTPFSGKERYKRRLAEIGEIEENN